MAASNKKLLSGFLTSTLGLFCLCGCSKPLTESECFDLLDHYTEAQIEQAHPSANRADRNVLREEARKKAQLDPAFLQCSDRVSREQFQCAMEAHSADQVERCLL